MNLKKKICTVLRVVSTVLVALVVILALLMVGPRLFKLEIYAVLSGSMEPEMHTGSLVYVDKDIDRYSLEVGDDITFWLTDSMPATHRIIEVVYDTELGTVRYKTQGIANATPDGGDGVLPENIIGCPVFTVPLLGFLAVYMQQPFGMYVSIGVVLVILWMAIIPDVICPKEKKKKKKKKNKKNKEDAEDNKDIINKEPTEEQSAPETEPAEQASEAQNQDNN